jgi:hypothetical protein
MASWWKVIDVTAWEAVAYETHGIRSKCWLVAPDGSRWLRKEPRQSRPYEPAIECLALEIAGRVGLDTARGKPCMFREGESSKTGIISRYFLDGRDEELLQGDQVLRRFMPHYSPEVRADHTVQGIRLAMTALEAIHGFASRSFGPHAVSGPASLPAQIFDLLLFDGWIGNSDRHPGNWATIGRHRVTGDIHWMDFRIAPMYDPASCLGAELQDDHPLLASGSTSAQSLEKYAKRCPSGFGDGDRLVKLGEVLNELHSWPEWQTRAKTLIAVYRSCLDNEVQGLLWDIPKDWLPEPRKAFAWKLLHKRLKLLEDSIQGSSTVW